MYNSIMKKSPGRKIERKQYVVLIEKEVPNLVLADIVISACRIILIGEQWKRPVTKDKSNRGRGFKQHDLFCPSSLVVCISISLTHLTKVKNDRLADNHETRSGA